MLPDDMSFIVFEVFVIAIGIVVFETLRNYRKRKKERENYHSQ